MRHGLSPDGYDGISSLALFLSRHSATHRLPRTSTDGDCFSILALAYTTGQKWWKLGWCFQGRRALSLVSIFGSFACAVMSVIPVNPLDFTDWLSGTLTPKCPLRSLLWMSHFVIESRTWFHVIFIRAWFRAQRGEGCSKTLRQGPVDRQCLIMCR